MPKKCEICKHIDWSMFNPGNSEPPICALGHGYCYGDCIQRSLCPEYEESIVLTWEEIKQ